MFMKHEPSKNINKLELFKDSITYEVNLLQENLSRVKRVVQPMHAKEIEDMTF